MLPSDFPLQLPVMSLYAHIARSLGTASLGQFVGSLSILLLTGVHTRLWRGESVHECYVAVLMYIVTAKT